VIISVSVDDARWSAGLDRLVELFAEKGREATLDGAEEIRDVAIGKLTALSHDPDTWTPSAPGMPPASISTDLAASMTALMMTEDQAWVGPTDSASSFNGPYGRIQELGGPMHGHPMMNFFRVNEGWFGKRFIDLPARPYLAPSTEDVVDSGRLTEIYIEHWTEAIEEATA
jgi:hypothetical protein